MPSRTLSPLPLFDPESLLGAFAEASIKPAHARRLWRLILQQGYSIDDVPELPKEARSIIDSRFTLSTSEVLSRTDARDGSTTKLLIRLQDGQKIETVIMRYGQVELESYPEEEKARRLAASADGDNVTKFKSKGRATVCVSSQVGCSMGCTFCATGTMGLRSHLTAGEILEQLIHANKIERIRNVVFMGMGEPLDNYSQVLQSIGAMTDTARFGLSASRISISTVGVVPRMLSLIKDAPLVGLALSLHAPSQSLRTQIVPSSKAWHIDRIMEAMDDFIDNQNASIPSHNRKRHVLVEYVLIANVNDSEETAKELGLLLQNRSVLLNVIPYNPTAVPFDYKAPSQEKTRAFVNTVKEFGVRTLQRQELGQDIASACGQLVVEDAEGPSSTTNGIEDLEDLMTGSKRPTVKKEILKRKGGSSRDPSAITSTKTASLFWQNALLNTILVLLAFFLYRWGTKTWAVEESL